MVKSVKNLLMLYLREKGLRDLMFIAIYALFIVIYYLLNNSYGLEWIRKDIVWIWIGSLALYTFLSAFDGYGNLRKSYCRVLLPVSVPVKFVWELCRTLVLFGGVLLAISFAVDMFFEYLTYHYTPGGARDILSYTSLRDTLFANKEPLNYLPIIVYIAVLCHSVALLISTKMSVIVKMSLVVATFVLIAFLPISDNHNLLYPFISQKVNWSFFSMQLSWASRSVEYLLSYLWLAALPVSIYTLSYFRIKEIEI